MAADDKWYFTKEQLAKTRSRLNGYDADKELSCRQQAANFIQDMGQRLQVTQLCINTAIVYMHRFYMFHSFTHFHRNAIAAAALFLAAKVEEQPRKLEHVIKVAQMCLHREQPPMDVKSELYLEQAQELVVNENILLQTLGFDVAIDHPHTHVVKCCQLVKASKDLAQTSYFMASNSLHLTTMCLQYKPTVVACFCIHLACKWSNWEIRQSSEGRPWFWYVDKTVTQELLEQLTEEFLAIFEKCPSRFKKKIIAISNNQSSSIPPSLSYDNDKKRNGEGSNSSSSQSSHHFPGSGGNSGCNNSTDDVKRKVDIPQRYPPDYKKPPHFPHHLRNDNSGVSSKSSCMFAPPMRTSSSSNLMQTSSSTSNSSSSQVIQQSRPKTSEPPIHSSHHRPARRPPVPPTSTSVHSSVPPSVINLSSVSKAPSPASLVLSTTSVPSMPLVNVVTATSVINTPSIPVSSLPHPGPTPVISSVHSLHPPPLPLLSPLEDKKPPLDSIYKKYMEPKMAPPILEPPPPAPISPPPPTPAPPVIKVERSIFSPEKSTPPTESTKTPTPGRIDLSSSLSLPDTLAFETKVKPKVVTSLQSSAPLLPLPTPPKPPVIIPPAPPHGAVPTVGVPSLPTPADIPSIVTVKEEKPDLKTIDVVPPSTEEHSSRSEQKKKKKKHKEHKEKHKDKHKHKHRSKDPEPIVITIPKEKLNLPPVIAPISSEQQGLKIKIAKDKISGAISPGPPPSGLKIKISKEKIKESSRKRERSGDGDAPPSKYHRPNGTTLQVGLDPGSTH